MALSTNRFGSDPELVAKRPGEGFVGAVSGIERNSEDVGSTVRQQLP